MSEKPPVVYIVGPTASGKTDISVKLAEIFSGEIVCCDSMQIYKGMHIASAAPGEKEKETVRHHMFEFLPADRTYSVSDYVKDANAVIADIQSRKKLPFVVGGTGLYAKSLSENIYFGEDIKSGKIREELSKKADENGLLSLYNELKSVDPQIALKISPNDRKRIIRALEVFKSDGITMSERIRNSRLNGPIYDNLFIGINCQSRETLYNRINLRVDKMLKEGLLEEAKEAFKKSGSTSFQAIGHKEFEGYFKGNLTIDQAAELLKMQTRRYAKRQITWFKKVPGIRWIYPDSGGDYINEAKEIISDFLKKGGEQTEKEK